MTPGDVPAWYALVSTVEEHDDAVERSSERDLADVFKGTWRDPARDSVGGFDAQGRLRAFARSEFEPVTAGTLAPILFGAVHPEYRRRGIGRALIEWSEARARQQLGAVDSSLPARIRVFTDDHHMGAKALAESTGFTPLRWYVEMRRDLAQPLPGVNPAEGIRIEGYSAERDEEVRVTHNESFARDHWGSSPISAESWQLQVINTEGFRPDWSFVAYDTATGGVVGYTLASAYKQDWEAQGFSEGWTDLLGVRREYRGRGIAGALLAASMAAFAESGIEYAGLDVDTENPTGALGAYTRLGYDRCRTGVLYAKELS
nr:GNAT family N-acetyltransferase [Phytoactinopolyspora mesophila]